MTTPKQIAESFVAYSRRHSDLYFASFVIPQIPGTLPRSRPIHFIKHMDGESRPDVVTELQDGRSAEAPAMASAGDGR